jgi:tetratricopeptide (TPR) repeat protein
MDNTSEITTSAPAYLRLARTEIDRENLDAAVELLDKAIAADAYYPTSYILLGQALTQLKRYNEAEDAYQKGAMLIGSKETFNYYISDLEAHRHKQPLSSESRRIAFFSDELKEELVREPDGSAIPIEDRLEDLAREISSAKIPPIPEEELVLPEDINSNATDKITINPVNSSLNDDESYPIDKESEPVQEMITETIAKIYLSQGKFREALDVYKKLKTVEPQNSQKYQQIIEEIESQLDDSQW